MCLTAEYSPCAVRGFASMPITSVFIEKAGNTSRLP